jgi:hypothetical protein
MGTHGHEMNENYSNSGRAEPTKKLFEIGNLCGARSTHVVLCFNKSGRAEPTKEAFDSISFVAKRPTEPHLFISGGRAEQSTKVIRFGFVDAHVPLTLYYVSTRVDVPSQQKKRLIAFLLWPNGQQSRIYSSLVDVPRFELGNRIAERIRCYILGFQFAQRINHLQQMRFGGEQ